MTASSGQTSHRAPFRSYFDVPLLLGGGFFLFAFGLFLPVVEISKIGGLTEDRYSIVTGIRNLWDSGNLLLALVVFFFSVLFPLFKFASLAVIWYRILPFFNRRRMVYYLRILGKWSMLDVFVVALLIGLVNFGFLAEAKPKVGIYLFGAGVLISMVVTLLIDHRMRAIPSESIERLRVPSYLTLALLLFSQASLFAGFLLPLMEVKKWAYWNQEYSLLAASFEMFREGDAAIAVTVFLFVILLPLVKSINLTALWFLKRAKRKDPSLLKLSLDLDKWTMVDVFALGIGVVAVKIGSLVEITPKIGLAFFVAGVFSSLGLSWMVRKGI